VTLAGTTSIIDTTNNGGNAAGGGITLGGAINGTAANTQSLTLNAGTGGAISATGNIGGHDHVGDAHHHQQQRRNVQRQRSDRHVGRPDQHDQQREHHVQRRVDDAYLTTVAQGYDLDILGGGTSVTNNVSFANTGTLALGDAAADTLTFTGGLTATAPSGVTVNGQIRSRRDSVDRRLQHGCHAGGHDVDHRHDEQWRKCRGWRHRARLPPSTVRPRTRRA
jgi:hypothetical protein